MRGIVKAKLSLSCIFIDYKINSLQLVQPLRRLPGSKKIMRQNI